MSETLKEVGKSLLALANLLMVVLFFKHHQETNDILYFYKGISYGVGLYIIGGLLILLGKDLEDM